MTLTFTLQLDLDIIPTSQIWECMSIRSALRVVMDIHTDTITTVSVIGLELLFLVRIWFSRGSSSPIYSETGFATPITVPLLIGDEEPRENKILMRKRILIQKQKLLNTMSKPLHPLLMQMKQLVISYYTTSSMPHCSG